jgi:ribosomal protein L11 methyltransferase
MITSSSTARPPWRRLHIDCDTAVADSIAALLLQAGALGLETEDDETRAVPGRAHVPQGRSLLTGTFSNAVDVEVNVGKKLQPFFQHVPKARDATFEWTDLFAEDWTAVFKSYWHPFRLSPHTWIVPSWERASFSLERVGDGPPVVALHLDPGMAFGTGQHETTALCARAIEEMHAQGVKVRKLLDVGTGTGILCILALKLGAAAAKGTDIDPVAVKAAIDNARDNQVRSFVANDDLPDADGAVFDVVIANILAGTLIDMKVQILGALARGGRLFLSGILAEQAPAVVRSYASDELKHVQTVERGEWVRIDFVRAK